MKKRVIFIVVTALLCCLLVACGSKTRLQAPQNIRQNGPFLIWDEVENAEGYILFVDNAEYKTVVPSYDLSFLDKETDYVVEIMAVGDGKSFLDSDWSEFGFNCRPSEQLVPTEGLGYKLLADGSGYEVRKGSCREVRVVIPSTYENLPVKRVAAYAFGHASELSIYYPDKTSGINFVTTEIVLPETIVEIGDSAFGNCAALKKINIPDGVEKIGNFAFFYTGELSKITLPDSLKSIGDFAFMYSGIQFLKIPDGIESVGRFAFSACGYLREAQLPERMDEIPEGMFFKCARLSAVYFPLKVESIGGFVIHGTPYYSQFYDYAIVNTFLLGYNGAAPMDSIPSFVTHIADGAFSQRVAIAEEITITYKTNCLFEKAVIPADVSLGENLFCDNPAIKEVVFEDGTQTVPDGTFNGCENLVSVTVPDSVTCIGKDAFMKSNLESIELPKSVTSIGWRAFFNCTSLKKIVVPDGIERIEDYTFASCKSLSEVVLPSALKEIGKRAFGNCEALTSIDLPLSVTSIGSEAFENCTSLKTIAFPPTIERIENNMLSGCTSLEEVALPSALKEIGEWAFSKCSVLESIDLPESVTAIGSGAFFNCTSLQRIVVPSAIERIEDSTFYGCKSLTEVVLPSALKEIGTNVFNNCIALTSIDLPLSVTAIGSSAFNSCSSLEKIVLPAGVTRIENNTFFDCTSLTEVVLPSALKEIGTRVFAHCKALKTMVLPSSLEDIGEKAFDNCPLESVFFDGTEAEFLSVSVAEGNDSILNAAVYFYSETEPTENPQKFWRFSGGKPLPWA